MNTPTLFTCLVVALTSAAQEPTPDTPRELSYKFVDKSLEIRYGDGPLLTYVYEDEEIPRPYIANVYTLEGRRVTRAHPAPVGPNNDHATFHPGIWLSFGDLNGSDFWRNKARTRGTKPVIQSDEPNHITFSASATFEAENGEELGSLEATYNVIVVERFYFIDTAFVFRPRNGSLIFGDQEEMGFGIRLDTPLTVKFGDGTIRNADGGIDETGTWGKASDWCTYSAEIEGRGIGVQLTPAAGNFRPSWFHSREYGLLVANPFGRNAMTGSEKSRVVVKEQDSLTLGFRLYVSDTPAEEWPGWIRRFTKHRRIPEP